MKVAYLEQLLEAKEAAKHSHAILRTSDSWREYVLARDTYFDTLAKAAPLLFAAIDALATITPSSPCWECGEYGDCVPTCTHGQARQVLAQLEALRIPRVH